MSIGTEIEKLNQLHKDGVLTELEYLTAKNKLLGRIGGEKSTGSGVHLIGKAANKYVNFKIFSAAISAVLFVLLFFTFFLPRFLKMEEENEIFSRQVKSEMQKHSEEMDKMSKDFDKSHDVTRKLLDPTKK